MLEAGAGAGATRPATVSDVERGRRFGCGVRLSDCRLTDAGDRGEPVDGPLIGSENAIGREAESLSTLAVGQPPAQRRPTAGEEQTEQNRIPRLVRPTEIRFVRDQRGEGEKKAGAYEESALRRDAEIQND